MSNNLENTLKQLTSKIHPVIRPGAPSDDGAKLIETVFEFAKGAYGERKRLSGENYIEHAVRVALVLSQMDLDTETISAGILHDVLDDLPASSQKILLKEIEKKFGKEITELVERISRLSRIQYSLAVNFEKKKVFTKEKIENLRKMFLAMAGDLRVILIELISRLDGLGQLALLSQEQQKLYAVEALEIFVPVADRLGLSEVKRRLEDLSFYYLFPERYKWLQTNIKEEYEERKKSLEKFIPKLKKILAAEKIKISDINYRAKSHWSTYRKLVKKDMDFDRVHDLVALRIIVPDIQNCYKTLGIIHEHFKPVTEEIDDYIARPKPNGYRSLHTTVFYERDKISEIQIRTDQMNKEAEYGVCAHWSYKEKINLKKGDKDLDWMKKAPDFWKVFKIDFFVNQIFVLTPKGDVITMKKGATPIDFAYAVHSDIGNHCESAKVGGKIVPLSYILENGDIVEAVTNKKKRPSADWLKFAKTNLAQSHIKKAISQTNSLFNFPLPGFIKQKFIEISEKAQKNKDERQQIKKGQISHIYLAGQKGMLVNIAKCCNPHPGDHVQAYLTKFRAAVLHKTSCENFQKLAKKFPDKIINASWE